MTRRCTWVFALALIVNLAACNGGGTTSTDASVGRDAAAELAQDVAAPPPDVVIDATGPDVQDAQQPSRDGSDVGVADDAPTDRAMGDDGPGDAMSGVVHEPVAPSGRCAVGGGVPLRTGASPLAFDCVRVGVASVATTAMWPDVTGLPTPVVYVQPSATGPSDGSQEHPYATLAAALAAPAAPATVALASGIHRVPDATMLARDVTIVGVGAGASSGTIVELSRGRGGFSRSGGALTLRGIAITYGAGEPSSEDVAVQAEGTSSLVVDDVSVTGAWMAFRVRGARASLRVVTVVRARSIGVSAERGATLSLRDFLVQGSGDVGVLVDASMLDAERGGVLDGARQGIAFTGDAPAGGGRATCAAGARDGRWSCLVQVAVLDNAVAGLALYGHNAVECRRSSLSRTRRAALPSGDGGTSDENGDGVLVTGTSELVFDPDIVTDAQRGGGTEVAENARVGVLFQGDGVSGTLRGARIASNGASGVFVAGAARVREVGYSRIDGNRLGGVIVVPFSSIAAVQCNGISDTQMGSVMTTTGTLVAGDGLSLNDSDAPSMLLANEVSRAERFAVVAANLTGSVARNSGSGSLFGLGLYGRLPGDRTGNTLTGLRDTPPSNPGLVGTPPR